jgi:hypothetical protein
VLSRYECSAPLLFAVEGCIGIEMSGLLVLVCTDDAPGGSPEIFPTDITKLVEYESPEEAPASPADVQLSGNVIVLFLSGDCVMCAEVGSTV